MTPAEAWVADTTRAQRKSRQQRKVGQIRTEIETYSRARAVEFIRSRCPRATVEQTYALIKAVEVEANLAESERDLAAVVPAQRDGALAAAAVYEANADALIAAFVSAHRRRLWGNR